MPIGSGRAPLKVAIIGTGFMGTVHARATRSAGAELVAMIGRTPQTAARAASELGATISATSLAEVLDGTDVDLVHVCTPNELHAEQVEEVIVAGKHVICEKPLAPAAATASRLSELAEDAGVVAAVPFVYRYYPMLREMRTRVQSIETGDLRLLRGSYLQDWLADEEDNNWRVDPHRGGRSRAFGDIGVHWCDLAEFVTGQRITRLVSATQTAVQTRMSGFNDEAIHVATEDIASVLFTTDGGTPGSVTVSQVSLGRKNQLELFVDGASAAYGFCQEEPETLWIGHRDFTTILPRGSASVGVAGARLDRVPAGHPQGYQDCFNAFVSDVHAAIVGEPPMGLPTFADGARAARIVDAVLTSAGTGTWVDIQAT